jgi:hypothetical protein
LLLAQVHTGWRLVGDIGRVFDMGLSALVLAFVTPLLRYRWRHRKAPQTINMSLVWVDIGLVLAAAQQLAWAFDRVGRVPVWYGLIPGCAWQVAILVGLYGRRHALRRDVAEANGGSAVPRRRHSDG